MITEYGCDRCGRRFCHKGYGIQYYCSDTDTSTARVITYGHLCPDCGDEFVRWMHKD